MNTSASEDVGGLAGCNSVGSGAQGGAIGSAGESSGRSAGESDGAGLASGHTMTDPGTAPVVATSLIDRDDHGERATRECECQHSGEQHSWRGAGASEHEAWTVPAAARQRVAGARRRRPKVGGGCRLRRGAPDCSNHQMPAKVERRPRLR